MAIAGVADMINRLFAVAALASALLAQGSGALMTNERIIDLVKSGAPTAEIGRAIGTARETLFHLSPAEIRVMALAGVTDEILKMMSLAQAGQLSPEGTPRPGPNDKPRVFVADSPNAWSANGSYFWGQYSAGSHPQTAELMKTIAQECGGAVVTNSRAQANYVVTFERESQKVIRRDSKLVIFNRNGDLVYSASTRALGNAVRNGCAVLK